ncbi:Cation transporter protein B [Perigonia lusca single nucleopolyhedrovirus]|uniref:Cation transporter protein B n=1 Tax=Perigonia lusca single nucleopolyhedrovirus TaxID=1675865 RepID=A0A0M3N1Y1_9ABAC|nr:Cation transporter protein B [Perigonia lusca single nucleopolyhedrovirus]AKN80574.1 Cation transporter protein B [Perigonia lusca single nucleopolyhedrovirus]
MFHISESLFKEEKMPVRAKRLFASTFAKYHKLDGGDEDVALHMARKAVEREYVKLNNWWIPKQAAEEIVRHEIDDDNDDDYYGNQKTKKPRRVTNLTKQSLYNNFDTKKFAGRVTMNRSKINKLNEDNDEDDDDDPKHDYDSDSYDENDDDDDYENSSYGKRRLQR